jgi:hypothetical protein
VRQIQKQYFPETPSRRHTARPRYSPGVFVRDVKRILESAGSKYCPGCNTVQYLCEFSPATLEHRRGHHNYCRSCLSEKQRRYYREHPEVHQRNLEAQSKYRSKLRDSEKIASLVMQAPQLARQVRKGSISLDEALAQIAAPSPEKKPIRVEPSVIGFLVAVTEYLTPEEIQQLKQQL